MDAVGPQVVPSVAQIRERFSARRGSQGRIEQTIRRILGIDLKMKQYAEGSRFVSMVVEEVGMPAFNQVWTSPDTLPTKAEFAHPTSGWSESYPAPSRMGPGAAVAELRTAVRLCLADLSRDRPRGPSRGDLSAGDLSAGDLSAGGALVLVACSGGADSLALAAAAAFVAPRLGLRVGGVTVDHGLQPGSAERAAGVAALLGQLGLDPVLSVAVTVPWRIGRPGLGS